MWDQRIPRTSTQFYDLTLTDEWVEYYLTDMTESLQGKKIDVSLRWEQMTTIGPYYSGMEHIGEFTMPDKIMEGKRRQSRPGPGSRVENY